MICLRLLQARIDQQFALIAELRKTNGKLEADIEVQKQTQIMLAKQVRNAFIVQKVLFTISLLDQTIPFIPMYLCLVLTAAMEYTIS